MSGTEVDKRDRYNIMIGYTRKTSCAFVESLVLKRELFVLDFDRVIVHNFSSVYQLLIQLRARERARERTGTKARFRAKMRYGDSEVGKNENVL